LNGTRPMTFQSASSHYLHTSSHKNRSVPSSVNSRSVKFQKMQTARNPASSMPHSTSIASGSSYFSAIMNCSSCIPFSTPHSLCPHHSEVSTQMRLEMHEQDYAGCYISSIDSPPPLSSDCVLIHLCRLICAGPTRQSSVRR
jgi:hypothetical protein